MGKLNHEIFIPLQEGYIFTERLKTCLEERHPDVSERSSDALVNHKNPCLFQNIILSQNKGVSFLMDLVHKNLFFYLNRLVVFSH